MTTATKFPRAWHLMQIGDERTIETLDVHQIQSQLGKVRSRSESRKTWRWTTKTMEDGRVIVRRVQ